MVTKGVKKKAAKKRRPKSRKQKKSLFRVLRQWSLPLFLFFLVCISLAATFYIIFLHAPSQPLF